MNNKTPRYQTVVSAVGRLGERWRTESARVERLQRAWSDKPPSHDEARDLLQMLGPRLSSMSQFPEPVSYTHLTLPTTPYV